MQIPQNYPQNLPLQNPTGFDERPKACYTDYNDTERVRNVRRIIACLLICAAVLLCFAGCINFSELESEGKEFSFDFKEDGSCKAVLGGVENNGSYTFNQTTVDIMYGNKEEKLKYDRGVLTLTFYYNNEATSYLFTKIE